jgi:uncharacterized delta-60 repeat protein
VGNFGTPLELVRLPDGKVAVAGNGTRGDAQDWGSARLTSGGVLDGGYSGDGVFRHAIGTDQSNGVHDLVAQSDGKLVAAGSASLNGQDEVGLARYTIGGALDTSFSFDGLVVVQLPGTVADDVIGMACATPAGTGRQCASGSKLLVAAEGQVGVETRVVVARFNSDGTIDHTFGGGNGDVLLGVTHFFTSTGGMSGVAALENHLLDVDSSGRILVAAGRDLYRLTSDGSLDAGFGSNGRVVLDTESDVINVIATPQGGALAAVAVMADGDERSELRRYTSAGALDSAFGSGGVVSLPDTRLKRIVIAGGKLVATGETTDPQHNNTFLPKVSRLLDEVLVSPPTFLSRVAFSTIHVGIVIPTGVGILVERRVHGRFVRVGRVPFGRKHKGRNRIRWHYRVNGRRLRPGIYFIRVRLLNRRGRVFEVSKRFRVRVPAPRKHHG